MGIKRRFNTTQPPIAEPRKVRSKKRIFIKHKIVERDDPAHDDDVKPLSASKVIVSKRATKPAKPELPSIKVNTGKDAMSYTQMVTEYILPQSKEPLSIFGRELRVTPLYSTDLRNQVVITGLLCEVNTGQRVKQFGAKKRIVGLRSQWYGMIKFFVKSTMEG